MTRVYKILTRANWTDACAAGAYAGSADDVRDGFIHLSSSDQVEGTAGKYFAGRADLVLAVFEAESLGPALKWEASRGGALFPHLYAPLPTAAAVEVLQMRLRADGVPDAGPLVP